MKSKRFTGLAPKTNASHSIVDRNKETIKNRTRDTSKQLSFNEHELESKKRVNRREIKRSTKFDPNYGQPKKLVKQRTKKNSYNVYNKENAC